MKALTKNKLLILMSGILLCCLVSVGLLFSIDANALDFPQSTRLILARYDLISTSLLTGIVLLVIYKRWPG